VAVHADRVLPAESAAKTFVLIHYARLVSAAAVDPTRRSVRRFGTGLVRARGYGSGGSRVVGAARTARVERQDISDARDAADRTDPMERNDPMERIEAKDPIDPIDRAEPTDPMESTEPLEAMLSTESWEPHDQRDAERDRGASGTAPSLASFMATRREAHHRLVSA